MTTALALTLGACAFYQPSTQPDAPRLRLQNAGYMNVHASLRTVDEQGNCGSPVKLPTLGISLPETNAPPTSSVNPTSAPVAMPREGMTDSPPSNQREFAELKVDPGVYSILLMGTTGYTRCQISGTVDLKQGGEYWLALVGTVGGCRADFKRVEPGAVRRWVPYGQSKRAAKCAS